MFVVASDDRAWCKENLANATDVIIVDEASPISDLALLSSLDHQIVSHGTFGVWVVLLSKAKTVVYPAPYNTKRYLHHKSYDQLNLPNFIQVNFTVHWCWEHQI